jgi:SAM-dependent methyltransferase
MTDETSKTWRIRGPEFSRQYLQGRLIDIGCGPDPIVAHAERFDLQDGDAQYVADVRQHAAYDTVYSSHCLEHMRDVPAALEQWWKLVRPGGHLILVVPDEDLYEQGAWPSLFNGDHKATFRLGKGGSWSPVSYDLEQLVCNLAGAELISASRQDAGYDHSLKKSGISGRHRLLFRMEGGLRRILGIFHLSNRHVDDTITRWFVRAGTPVDQTLGRALAQIQVIVRKRAGTAHGGIS